MKGFLLNLVIAAFMITSTTSFALVDLNKPGLDFTYWNPVTIYNDAPYDVQYSFASRSGGNYYFLQKGMNDVYHSGFGDSCAEIIVVACTERSKEGACLNVVTHVSPVFYNVNMIKDVHILSVASLKVTCSDGGLVTCIVK